MSRDRKLVVALLGAIAILLALNLVGEPEAQADHGPPPDLLSAAPVPVAMSMIQDRANSTVYWAFRMWSDGSVDTTRVPFLATSNPDTACTILDACTVEVPID